jgi:hypothetical protein
MFKSIPFQVVLLSFIFLTEAVYGLGGTGAQPVDESLIEVTLYVDASAPDGGNGTQASPFNSIQPALNQAVNNHNANSRGVRVLIAPGTYRSGSAENLTAIQFPSPSTPLPVIIEGAGWSEGVHTGDVIITGSEVWTDWTDEGDGTWSKPWTYAWGVGPNNTGGGNPPEAMLRYEWVHVNGDTYYQFNSGDDPNLQWLNEHEGAFWVDEAAERITIRPPASVSDLNDEVVEVTTRRRLVHFFRPQANTSPTNIVLRNLVFQHGSGGLNTGAVFFQNAVGLHVEDCVFRNNKHMGGVFSGIASEFTVRRTDFIGNGEMGSGIQGVNVLYEDVRWMNNARQADVVRYYGWGYGGIKIGESSNLTFRRVEASNNYGMGIWFDTGNVACLVEDSLVLDNTSYGIWSENNNRNNIAALGGRPTVVVRRTLMEGNYRRTPQANANGGGFYITEAENTVIENSVLFDNASNFRVADGPGRGPTANTTIRSSVLASRQGELQPIYIPGWGNRGWAEFFDTLSPQTGNNDYYFTGMPTFTQEDGEVPNPQPASDATVAFYDRTQTLNRDLAGWKALHSGSGADADSRWIANFDGHPLVTVRRAASFLEDTGDTVDGFILTRVVRDVSSPLTVTYTAGGSAEPGVHYEAFPGTVIFPAGEREVIIPFTSIPQTGDFDELTVSVTLIPQIGYLASDPTATFTLGKTGTSVLPRVSVEATQPLASESGPTAGVFTLSRTGSTAESLTVNYSVGGTAGPSRYQPLSGSATFSAGAETATVSVIPVNDSTPQLTETVVLELQAGTGYILNPDLATSATVSILDNDTASPRSIQRTMTPTADPLVIPITLNNASSTKAQTFTVTLPDFSNYSWSDSNQPDGPEFVWNDIRSIGTRITEGAFSNGTTGYYNTRFVNGQSGAEGGIPIGFGFPLYGTNFDEVFVGNKGMLVFDRPNTFQKREHSVPLPDNSAHLYTWATQKFILFYWEDLVFPQTGERAEAHFHQVDADTFIIQFSNVRLNFAPTSRFTAQTVLRSNGTINFYYLEHDLPTPRPVTVGIQDARPPAGSPTRALQIAHSTDYVNSNLAVEIRPGIPWISSASPGISFEVEVPAGSSETFDIVINPDGLDLETYQGQIQITSSHPDQQDVNIPVSLTVSDVPVPSTPSDLIASALSSSEIKLAWTDNADNEDGYIVEVAESAAGPFTLLADLPADATEFTHSGLDFDTTLFYRVYAYNVHGPSNATDIVSATTRGTPAAPSGLGANAINPATIFLTWTDQSDDETAFVIERSPYGLNDFSSVATLPADTVTWSDTGLPPGSAFSYRVRASNAYGTSAASNTASATTPTLAQYHGVLRFSASALTVDEDEPFITLSVERTGGSAGEISVQYATQDGTALAGTDYTGTTGELIWPDGDSTDKTIQIPLLDHAAATSDRDFQVLLSNPDGGAETGAPDTVDITIVKLNPPPQFLSSSTLSTDVEGQVGHELRITREIRAFFDDGPIDTYPGTAGEGWLTPWTIQATAFETTASAERLTEPALRPGTGEFLSFSGTAAGAGKRTFVARSYGDEPERGIDRSEPHRIVFLLRVDDISGFAATNDRILLWDRLSQSNAAHFSNPETMTWGIVSQGADRIWHYYAPTLTTTGIAMTQGHVYQFVIDVEPAQNRYQLSLTDLNLGTSFSTQDWVPFRNADQEPDTVGGHLHFGAYLDSAPQTATISIDSVRILPAGLVFGLEDAPQGVSIDAASGYLSGEVSGSGQFVVTATDVTGTGSQMLFYDLGVPFQTWQEEHFSEEDLNDPTLEETVWGLFADPDEDGIPNLLEFAFNGNPNTPNSIEIPTAEVDGGNFGVRFFSGREGVAYHVEVSSDLLDWTEIHVLQGGVQEYSTVWAHEPSGTQPVRFLRVRVVMDD